MCVRPRNIRAAPEREPGERKGRGNSGHAGCIVTRQKRVPRHFPSFFPSSLSSRVLRILLVSLASSQVGVLWSFFHTRADFAASQPPRSSARFHRVFFNPLSLYPRSFLLFSRGATWHISRGFSSLKLRKRRQIGNHMLRFFSFRNARDPWYPPPSGKI